MNARHTVLALVVAMAATACGGNAADPTPTAATAPVGPTATQATQPATQAATQPAAHPTESSPPGDIPDDTVFLPFRPQGQGYEVKIPEGWERTDLPTGASFSDKLNSVRIEIGPPSDPPGIERVDQKKVSRKGGEAELTRYRVDSAPDPVTNKVIRDEVERYVFTKGGRRAVLTLTGPVGADNVDPWRTVSDSFRWTS
ncbi:hypothetical protein [Sphaerisporangium sp. NPDC051011]|uniref:hypothetical protein n=1 Tax=Sphaerisporangium sp. NPDC051011 TaxID=3155792 RepID=UPI00340678BA